MFMALGVGGDAFAEGMIMIGVLLVDGGSPAVLKTRKSKRNPAIQEVNAAGRALGEKFEADFIFYPGAPDATVEVTARAEKDGALFITGKTRGSASTARIVNEVRSARQPTGGR